MQMTNPSSTIQLQHQGDAFVDDSYLVALATDSTNPIQSAVDNLSNLGQSWERGLFSTGGAINLQKSFWVLLAWKWKAGKASLLTPDKHQHQLLLTAGYDVGNLTAVPQLSPHDSYRTLGAYISPAGHMAKAFEVLKEHSTLYSTRIQASRLNREAALWSFLLYLWPKLTFPLMATTFTETQCEQILSSALRAVLPKLYLNRNTARSIIHGPVRYEGMNLPHVYTYQGASQLKFVLGHLRAQDKTLKLILINHGYHQFLVGTTTNFLESNYKSCHNLVGSTWFVTMWKFLSKLRSGYILHKHGYLQCLKVMTST
jgi:hypothetical protein